MRMNQQNRFFNKLQLCHTIYLIQDANVIHKNSATQILEINLDIEGQREFEIFCDSHDLTNSIFN